MGFFHRTSDSGSSSVALSRSSTDSYASTADTSDTSYQGSASVSPNTPLPKSSSSSSLRAFFASPKQFIFPPPAVFYPASTTTTDHTSYRSRGTSFDRQHSSSQATSNSSAGLERKSSRRKQRSQSFHVLTPSSTQTWLSPDGSSHCQSDFLLEIACSADKAPIASAASSRRNSLVLMSTCHATNSRRDSSVDSLASSVSRQRTRSIEYAVAAGTSSATTSTASTPTGTPQSTNPKQLSPLQEFRRSNSATRPFPLRSSTAPPISPTQLSKNPPSARPVNVINALTESARERPSRADGLNDENDETEEDEDDDNSTLKLNRKLPPKIKPGGLISSSSAGFRADSPSGRSLQGRRPIGSRGYTTTPVSASASSSNATAPTIHIDRVPHTTRRPIHLYQTSTRTSTGHSVPFPSTASSNNLAHFPSRQQSNQLDGQTIPLITTSPPSSLTSSTTTFKPKSRRTLSLPFQPHLALSIIEPAESSEMDVVTPTATTFPPTLLPGADTTANAAISPSSSTSTITPRPRTSSTFSRPLTTSLKGALPEVAPSQIPSSASMACLSTFSSWDFPPARAESLAAKHKVLSPLESYVFPTTSRSHKTSSSNSLMLPPPVPPPRSVRRSIIGGQPAALMERALNPKASINRPNAKSYPTVPTVPLASSSTAPILTSTTIAQTSSSSSSSSLSSTALSLAALAGPSGTGLRRSKTVNSIVHIQGPSQSSPPTVPPRHPNRAKLRSPQSYSLQNCKTSSVETNLGSLHSHPNSNSVSSTVPSSSPVYTFPLESLIGANSSTRRSLSPSLNGYASDSGYNHHHHHQYHHHHPHEIGFGSISTPSGWAERRGSHSSSSSLRQEVFPFERQPPLDFSHSVTSPISSERSSAAQLAVGYNLNAHRPGIGARRQTTGGSGPGLRRMERTSSMESESSSSGFSSFVGGANWSNYDPSVHATAIDSGIGLGTGTGGTLGTSGKTRSKSSMSLAGLLGGFTRRGSNFWDGSSKKSDDDDHIDEFGRQKLGRSLSDEREKVDDSRRRGRERTAREEDRESKRDEQEEEDEDEEEFCSFGNM